MANKERGEVDLVVAGQPLVLRLSINALCQVEDMLDLDITGIAKLFGDVPHFRLSTARVMLWAALRENHPEIDLEAAGDLVGKCGMMPVIDKLGEAIVAAFPAREGVVRPPKASRRG